MFDPRFYYIRLVDLQLEEWFKKEKQQQEKNKSFDGFSKININEKQKTNLNDSTYQFRLQMGDKYSSTLLNPDVFKGDSKKYVKRQNDENKEQQDSQQDNIFSDNEDQNQQQQNNAAFSILKTQSRIKEKIQDKAEVNNNELRNKKNDQKKKQIKKQYVRKQNYHQITDDKNRIVEDQAHLFQYAFDQYLNVFLEEKNKKKEKQDKDGKDQDTKKKGIIGFSRVFLTPLMKYPHTRHTVKVPLIQMKKTGQIQEKVFATVILQIYFRLDFQGEIEIIPLEAIIKSNATLIGDVRPYVSIQLEGHCWRSLDSGGTHPHWSGFYHTSRNKYQNKYTSYTYITNIGDNIQRNKHSIQLRQEYHKANLDFRVKQQKKKSKEKKQEQNQKQNVEKTIYFDIMRFHLSQVKSPLKIELLNDKIVGQPFKIGECIVNLTNQEFLRFPGKDNDWAVFKTQEIDLFKEEDEQKFVGKLRLLVKFIFDKERVLDINPFMIKMSQKSKHKKDSK